MTFYNYSATVTRKPWAGDPVVVAAWDGEYQAETWDDVVSDLTRDMHSLYPDEDDHIFVTSLVQTDASGTPLDPQPQPEGATA